jgi:hypothetical protein
MRYLLPSKLALPTKVFSFVTYFIPSTSASGKNAILRTCISTRMKGNGVLENLCKSTNKHFQAFGSPLPRLEVVITLRATHRRHPFTTADPCAGDGRQARFFMRPTNASQGEPYRDFIYRPGL